MPVWSYLIAVPVFGGMILVHEFGHYLAARASGIAVAEFAVGFGPRLLGFQWRGTAWNLRLIPLGGYVRWHEDGPGAFQRAPLLSRALALLCGPLANLALTVLMVAVMLAVIQDRGWSSLWEGVRWTGEWIGVWVEAVVGLVRGGGLTDLAGPVEITRTAAEAVVRGPVYLGVLTAFLSLNIGLFNLLPLPGLDGGRLLLLGLERIRRRPLDPYVEGWIHAGGFVLLIALALLTTVRDLLV